MIRIYAKRRGVSQRQVYRMCSGQTKNPVQELEEAFERLIPPELDPAPVLEYLCFKHGYVIAEVPITMKQHQEALTKLKREMDGQLYLHGIDPRGNDAKGGKLK